MDSEDIVICTPNNKWPFSYSLGKSPSSKEKFSLATEPSFTVVQKEEKNPDYVTQNTLHFVTYFGNVFW